MPKNLKIILLIKSKCVRNSWGHNVENVQTTESLPYQEWVSILSKYVNVTFRQIDFSTSQDITKKQIFFGKIG